MTTTSATIITVTTTATFNRNKNSSCGCRRLFKHNPLVIKAEAIALLYLCNKTQITKCLSHQKECFEEPFD